MINNNKLKIMDDFGIEKEYNILFTFDLRETGKSYVVYTDYSKNEEGNIRTFCSIYDARMEFPKLQRVKENYELAIINDILKRVQENILAGNFDESIKE